MGESHTENSVGRPPAFVSAEVVREITPEDLVLLGERERPPSSLRKIRDHHHRIARLVAEGKGTTEVAQETGMSISRISILKSDPAFQELIVAYRKRLDSIADDAFAQVQRIRALNLQLALEEQQDRLFDQPETFANRDLQDVIADTSDRLDMGKTAKHLHGHVDLADNLALARERRLRLSAPTSPPERQSDAEAPGSGSLTPAEHPTPVASDEVPE